MQGETESGRRRDGERTLDMTTLDNAGAARDLAGTAPLAMTAVLGVAALGALLLFLAGQAQSAALHDAAHDVRHATGFPCH